MKLKSGWGMTETCSPGTGHPKEGPEKPGSIGLMLPGIEMDVVALEDPKQALPAGEVGEIRIRGPNVQRLLEPARKPPTPSSATVFSPATSATWTRRLFLPGRPQEGHDHFRRLQRLSADDRAGDLRPPRGARGDRDRDCRRISRRGGESLRQVARWRQPFTMDELRRSGRQARQARNARGAGIRRRSAADPGRQTSRHELRNAARRQERQEAERASGGGTETPRRPGERRDPYAAVRFGERSAAAFANHERRWIMGPIANSQGPTKARGVQVSRM